MECVETVRPFFYKHKEIFEQSGGGETSRKNGGREGKKGCFGRSKVVHKWWLLDLSRSTAINSLSYILSSNPLIQTIAV